MESYRLKVLEKARNMTIGIRDNLIWVGTEKGLCSIDRVKRRVVQESLIKEGTLSEDESLMAEIALDEKHGVLWLAVKGRVIRFDGKNIKEFKKENGFPEGKTPYCIKVNSEGTVWLGYYGQIYRFDGKNWRKMQFKLEQLPASVISAYTFGFDNKGLTYGADTHVLSIINGDNAKFLTLDQNFGSLKGANRPSCVHVGLNNTIWIGTRGNGVLMVRSGAVQRIGGYKSGSIESSLGIKENSEGDVWVCSHRSLFKINRMTCEVEEHSLKGIIPGVVLDFELDADEFWFVVGLSAQDNPYSELVILQKQEILAPARVFNEKKGIFDGLPVVRVSHFEYAVLGVMNDFWSTSEHQKMSEICRATLKDANEEEIAGFQSKVLGEITRLGKELGEKKLEDCLAIFIKAHVSSIPALAEKIQFDKRKAWVFVANWGFDSEDYSHIFLEVIDEETGEVLMSEACM